MDGCVFCGIVSGKIPADFVFQDGEIAVFPDLHPAAPLHLLIIPKKHVSDFVSAEDQLVLKIKEKIVDLVSQNDLMDKGYRIIVNGGSAKGVPHLHFHLLGRISASREV